MPDHQLPDVLAGLGDAVDGLLASVGGAGAALRAASAKGGRAPAPALQALALAQERLRTLREFLREPTETSEQDVAALSDLALRGWVPAFTKRSIAVQRRFAARIPKVRAHPERLRSALHQLLRNAYEAMPRGGRLQLELALDGGEVVWRATDSGAGFPAEVLADPFRPFRGAGRARLGIGLALAERVAGEAGGRLRLSNASPKGGRVELRLPPAADPPPAPETP